MLLLFRAAATADGGAASDQTASNLEGGCVLAVGDLNGDGIPDYAASDRAATGPPVVYLLFGRSEPLPPVVDTRYLEQNAAVVLRGPSAVPFTCPDEAMPIAAGRAPAVASSASRRPRADNPIGQPISYTMIDLDPLMPANSLGFSSSASGINAKGQVVGRFFTQEGDRAYVYDSGELRDLGTLGGFNSAARAINDAGDIVGDSLTGEIDASGFVGDAFVSDGHTMQDLGVRWSAANGINDAGQIVGEMLVQPNLNHAFLYEQGVPTDLGSLPPLNDSARSSALAINEAGQIVGESNTFGTGMLDPSLRHSATHAFVYEQGTMHDLGTLGVFCSLINGQERCGDRSTATAINNPGLVVGFSTTSADGSIHAFATTGNGPQDLGTLGGSGSWAYGANDSGQIVGQSLDANGQFLPFLYDHGTMYDLNTLILNPSENLPFAAYAVNNFGQIAANHHLLNPVYESVAPGRKLSFTASLGETLTFEYWIARGDTTACHALRNHLRLQVKIDTAERAGTWRPAAVVVGCDESTDWGAASLTIPEALRDTSAKIHIRVRESGNGTCPLVHLRHFGTE
jgi:probable HAF family extracellular repeat protein